MKSPIRPNPINVILLLTSLAVASCSSDPDTTSADATETAATATPDTTATTDDEPEPETTTTTTEAPEPVAWWPAPAAPYQDGTAVTIDSWSMASHDDNLYMVTNVDLVRYDVATGEMTTTVIPQGDDPWSVSFGLISGGDHLMVSAIADHEQFGLDIGASFDAELNRLGHLDLAEDPVHGSVWPDHGFAPGGRITTSSFQHPNTWVIDPATMTYVEPLPFTSFDSQVAHDGDAWWVIDTDGTGGVYADDGTELATIDIGRPLDWFQSEAMRQTDDEVWFADLAVPAVFRFDRSTYELIATVDLTTEFDADVRLVDFSTGGEYAIASVGPIDTGGYVLVRFHDDASIRSVHHVAPTDLEYWNWGTFATPEVEVVGDRVFVIDSLFRVQEIDVAALDEPSGAVLVPDPGPDAPMTPEEVAAVAEVIEVFGLGDDWSGRGFIRGDRAWVGMSQAVPGNTLSFAERIDGEWVRQGGAWP